MKKSKTIIIHSKVATGFVGSNTTAFVLQTNGYDVITIPTVLYSSHLGYPVVGGGKIPDDLFSSVLKGISVLGILADVSTIITGFMGSAEQVRVTADFIRMIRQKNPDILYLCDPVMGDTDKGMYVEPDVADAVAEQLVPLADLLTPNQFEAEKIIRKRIGQTQDIHRFLQQKFDLSKQKIVITGCGFAAADGNLSYNCIAEEHSCHNIKIRKIDLHPPGTGELFTAHLYLSMLRGMKLIDAVALSGDILSAVLQKMYNENRTEFELSDMLFSLNILKQETENEYI